MKTTDKNESTPAAGLQWRCKVTAAGARKTYGTSKHLRGRGAVVLLTEAEADAAEKHGWITRIGIAQEAPAAG